MAQAEGLKQRNSSAKPILSSSDGNLIFLAKLFGVTSVLACPGWKATPPQDESRAGADVRARSAVAIAQLRWNKSCHFDPTGMSWRASVQPLMTPFTGNDAGWPRCRSCQIRAGEERASIIANDGVSGRGLRSRTLGQNLVLKTAGQRDNAFLRFIRRQNSTLSSCCFPGHFHFLLLFVRTSVCSCVSAARASSSVSSILPPARASFRPRRTMSGPPRRSASAGWSRDHSERITDFVFLRLERQDTLGPWLGCWSRLRRRRLLSASSGAGAAFAAGGCWAFAAGVCCAWAFPISIIPAAKRLPR